MISAAQPQRRVFGRAAYTEYGIRHSTYVLETERGCVSIGSMPEDGLEAWIQALKDIARDRLTDAVFLGLDCDAKAAVRLIEVWPQVRIILSSQTLAELSERVNGPVSCVEIRTDREFDVAGKALRFVNLPTGTEASPLCLVDQDQGTLFAADIVGSLYGGEAWRTDELNDTARWLDAAEDYLTEIDAEGRIETVKAMQTLISDCGIRMVCPWQGPVIDGMEDYPFPQAAEKAKEGFTLAVVYAPGRFVRDMAQRIRQGAEDSGVANVIEVDLGVTNRKEALRRIVGADAWLFGTPELDGDAAKAVWDVLTSLKRRDCQGKTAAVFCASTVLGKTAFALRQRLAQLECNLKLNDFFVQGIPDARTLESVYEYGFHAGCYVQKIPNPRKPALVMCLVCGEIFDASLGACPVCGVGLDQCVSVEQDDTAYRNDTQCTYLILGGGAAAVSAAETIRLRDRTGKIVMLSAEAELPINRPMLTKDFAGIAENPEGIAMHGADWYVERDIELRLGIEAVQLLPEEKTVIAAGGERFSYDKLVYAAGAECFVPPFEGHDRDGLFVIRHLRDNLKLQECLRTAECAVVIGGGVLGLEAASEMMRAGVKVTVLEATNQIVGRQIDAQSAAIMKSRMEKLGVECYEGVSIAAIEGDGRVTGVRLADGRVFPAQVVVISCGNRANIGVARDAGAVVERAIVVDDHMRTTIPDVYACGDCAQFEGLNYQQWQEATNQGRVAGANAAGEEQTYANRAAGLSLDAFGTSLYAIGDPGKHEGVVYQTVELSDGVTGRHEKYWFFAEALQGAVLINAPWKIASVTQAVATHARHGELFGEE